MVWTPWAATRAVFISAPNSYQTSALYVRWVFPLLHLLGINKGWKGARHGAELLFLVLIFHGHFYHLSSIQELSSNTCTMFAVGGFRNVWLCPVFSRAVSLLWLLCASGYFEWYSDETILVPLELQLCGQRQVAKGKDYRSPGKVRKWRESKALHGRVSILDTSISCCLLRNWQAPNLMVLENALLSVAPAVCLNSQTSSERLIYDVTLNWHPCYS